MATLEEKGKYNASWTINKFRDPDNKIAKMLKNGAKVSDLKDSPCHKSEEKIKGNLLLNAGINELWDVFIGDSTDTFDNAEATIGVGNDPTTAVASQTDLLGGSTDYQEMDATYPQRGAQVLTFRATFETGDANFDWREFVIKQNTSGKCLNRKVFDQGIKTVAETWLVTLAVSIS